VRFFPRRNVSLSLAEPAPPTVQVQAGTRQAGTARLKLKRWLRRAVVLGQVTAALAVIAGLGLTGLFLTYSLRFPDPLSLAQKRHTPVIQVLARDGTTLATRGISADYMPLDLLPGHVADAVIAIEDRRFYTHWGIDPWGLLRAAGANLRAGRFAQGGSTLTQQLAKNLFLSPERTLWRKVEELSFALWLELQLSKRDILELYLNRVYFGSGAYGIEGASQRYFGTSARALTVPQAAVLAGVLKAPATYSPLANPAASLVRARTVIAAMVAAGTVSPQTAHAAAATPPTFQAALPRAPDAVAYAVDYALERMPAISGSANAEVIVETTIDARLQTEAHRAVVRELDANGTALKASQAAVVVLDRSGGVRAVVGGRSFADSQFNRAVKARRQPGSAFKPFVYLAALESGLSPDTVGYDLPLSIKGWSPRNDNGRFLGAITLRQALATSVNTVAVRLHLDLPKGRVVAVARRLGITSELHDQPALALGASEVTLLELTGGYGVLSNEGRAVTPHVIERVRLASGEVLYQHAPSPPASLVARAHVAAMNDMLGEVMSHGTGKRARLADRAAGGKTGTTQDFRDAWFVGYTAQMTAGVWVGNDNGQPMNHVMGGSMPARIWHTVMTAAHTDQPAMPLPGMRGDPPVVSAVDGAVAATGAPTMVGRTDYSAP
jgi:penicillin-binding protein 1A